MILVIPFVAIKCARLYTRLDEFYLVLFFLDNEISCVYLKNYEEPNFLSMELQVLCLCIKADVEKIVEFHTVAKKFRMLKR
jgi:hypothetical protein